jgi:hypothetical protein
MGISAQSHNDQLMATGYTVLKQCKELSLPCFIWGGGAIYHMLKGKLDYRKMSDIEFLLPKSADHKVQEILTDLGFIPYSTFNNMQNMYSMPRREFYLPDRTLSDQEVENLKHGRKSDIENVNFQKVELFVDGIRMCWQFKLKDLPKSYTESIICPPGFQIALKTNPIHPDDFDLKDVQDISYVLNQPNVTLGELDTIFREPSISENMDCCIGTKMFEKLANAKDQFATTVSRNFNEVLKYEELSDSGRSLLNQLVAFLEPLKKRDEGGFLSKMRREKPVRVDNRQR